MEVPEAYPPVERGQAYPGFLAFQDFRGGLVYLGCFHSTSEFTFHTSCGDFRHDGYMQGALLAQVAS